ncbi:hypothetical protein [Amycolatopsis cihanbeyliensis]|uniref:Uncharacterized protein n=1 Tax=Amycolatopsis cihanbeyliensis TaxID=1128664 RepID=A0A542DIN7_AMYCI|nr:hypothetical protein [Amycolatopsis cihanbeyliensis]TQJ02916.1 hypothetical protein FB471_2666 [Amycolatopsis cihanbeyliensis]
MAAHNALVDKYNAKAAVYNECKAIVSTARTMKENAHRALREVMGKIESGLTEMMNLTRHCRWRRARRGRRGRTHR